MISHVDEMEAFILRERRERIATAVLAAMFAGRDVRWGPSDPGVDRAFLGRVLAWADALIAELDK